MKNKFLTGALVAGTMAIGCLGQVAPVEAFTITSQLLGDPRPSNPDGLVVDVLIQAGTSAGLNANQARWTVDINSPDHPDARLREFGFNLLGNFSNYSFANFDPGDWVLSSTSPSGMTGSGNTFFNFLTNDSNVGNNPQSPPNVTNSRNLTFIMTKLTGDLVEADFLNALLAQSNDSFLGSFQLGARLTSLTNDGSGVAVGNYVGSIPEPIPTPALLPGAIGMGIAAFRKKKREQGLEAATQEA